MTKEIITKINREKGFDYAIDKEGNVTKEKYNWLHDKTTLVVIAIIILGGLYYFQMSSSVTNAKNFDSYCTQYYEMRNDFILNNPNEDITVHNVIEYAKTKLNQKDNITFPNG